MLLVDGKLPPTFTSSRLFLFVWLRVGKGISASTTAAITRILFKRYSLWDASTYRIRIKTLKKKEPLTQYL
jgi:hypothetical protein